jgi:hypothetical protein
MTSAVASKPKDALTELQALERVWQRETEQEKALGRELSTRNRKLYGYLDDWGLLRERDRLINREPAEYHPDGVPRRKDSKAGRLQAAIDENLDGLDELAAEVEHARRVEKAAKRDVDAFVAANLDAILDGLRAQAEAVAADVNRKAGDLTEALDAYVGFHGRVAALLGSVGRDTRAVPGLDAAADLKRTFERVELPAPVPEASHEH